MNEWTWVNELYQIAEAYISVREWQEIKYLERKEEGEKVLFYFSFCAMKRIKLKWDILCYYSRNDLWKNRKQQQTFHYRRRLMWNKSLWLYRLASWVWFRAVYFETSPFKLEISETIDARGFWGPGCQSWGSETSETDFDELVKSHEYCIHQNVKSYLTPMHHSKKMSSTEYSYTYKYLDKDRRRQNNPWNYFLHRVFTSLC